MPDPATFERYFHDRAELAEQLYRDGWRHEAVLIASVALDALANICEHDQKAGRTSHLERFRRFVEHYSADADARKIAVVFLAEDMIRHGPSRLHDVARSLLAKRNVDPGEKIARPMEFATSPFAHLDADWSALTVEEPTLLGEGQIEQLATQRYTYAALVYSLTRCAVAHALSRGSRTSDFSSGEPDEEISYFPPYEVGGRTRPISLKVGLRKMTQWLRGAATNYSAECERLGKTPADGFDPNANALATLSEKWEKIR